MASALLRLIRQARAEKAAPSIFIVNADDGEEAAIAAAEAAGQIGPGTVIIRQFSFSDLDAEEIGSAVVQIGGTCPG